MCCWLLLLMLLGCPGVRETAANLPDKQRRDYVAAMVAQMAGLMGLEDEEDSE